MLTGKGTHNALASCTQGGGPTVHWLHAHREGDPQSLGLVHTRDRDPQCIGLVHTEMGTHSAVASCTQGGGPMSTLASQRLLGEDRSFFFQSGFTRS